MKHPRIKLTPELADTIVKIHHNGAFTIQCDEWYKLYRKAHKINRKQRELATCRRPLPAPPAKRRP